MLITNFKNHLKIPIRGIIHVGAHHAEEKPIYSDLSVNNIVWIDANNDYYEILKNKVGEDKIIISAVGNVDGETTLNVSNNGQSSSILEMKLHKNHHPGIFYTQKKEVKIRKLKTLFKENDITFDNFNFINLDIQGYELEALKGLEECIEKIDYVYTEINTNYLYENCAILNEIDDYLKKHNFTRVLTELTHWEWGDAFYVKNNLI